jgi:hypothetical protein
MTIRLILLTLALLPALHAQATFGAITGTVTDSTGAVVPKATVQVINQDTGLTKEAVSNAYGDYEVTHLNPARYTVRARSTGFKKFEHQDILVEALRTVRIHIRLEVGDVGAEVTVTAGTPVVETDAPNISDLKTARQLRDLPMNTLNGVLLNIFLFTTPTGYQTAGSKFALGGARGTQLHYSIDGISANSPAFGVQNSPAEPSVESIQEMRFDIVDNKAEFGEVTNVTVITKSGQNDFHGRLFEFNGASALNATPFLALTKGQNTVNDFGGSAGGRIIRNKTFFFGGYEGFRQRMPAVLSPNLPTAKMRRGDFSDLLAGRAPVAVRNPFTNEPFAGNLIPSALFNSAAVKWQERFFPLPNFGPPDSTVANFRASYPQQFRQDQFDIRVDHYFSSKNTLYARFGFKRFKPHALDSGVPPEFAGYRVNVRNGRLAAVSDTWTISPRLVNELKVGFARGYNPREGELSGQEIVDLLGIQGLPRQPLDVRNLPTVSISGFQTIAQVAKAAPAENTFQVIDQVTHIRGRHTLKTGGEYRPQQYNEFVQPMFGSYTFTNRFTNYAYADFLLGVPQSTSRNYVRPSQAARYWFLSGFIQDDFKVSPRLTLSYGLRYEYDKPAVDKFDTIANFDPRTGSIVVPTETVLREKVNPLFPREIPIVTAQQAGSPGRSLREGDKNNFQPRFGFAFRAREHKPTVIRGGYGVYNDDLTADLFSQLYGGPYRLTESFTNSIANGVPQLTFIRPFLERGSLGAVDLTAIDVHLRNPCIQQWNLTVEQEIGFNTGLRLSYIGAKSTHLIYGRNINQPPASAIPFSQNRRPYPLLRNITFRENGANHIYHGLTVEAKRRFQRGLSFQAAWTWAKNLADADEVGTTEGGPTLEDAYNRVRERGDVQFNPRHRFISSLIWELPAGAGRRFLNRRGPLDWVLGGWQLSAIYNTQTGEFLTPAFSGSDPSNTQSFGGVPDRIKDGNLPSTQRSLDHWFDPSAFAAPPNGRFGNAGHGILEGPSRQAMNLGLFKNFHTTEKSSLRFQATFTNATNHPNYGTPNLNISQPGAVGTIRSFQGRDSGGPRMGLLGLLFTF